MECRNPAAGRDYCAAAKQTKVQPFSRRRGILPRLLKVGGHLPDTNLPLGDAAHPVGVGINLVRDPPPLNSLTEPRA